MKKEPQALGDNKAPSVHQSSATHVRQLDLFPGYKTPVVHRPKPLWLRKATQNLELMAPKQYSRQYSKGRF
jgi:hypothetical protein